MTVYRIGAGWAADFSELDVGLGAQRFSPCSASQPLSSGWIEPRGNANGHLVEAVAGQWLMKLQIEKKLLPASVVKSRVEERASQIEQTTGRKPGKRELRDLKDEAVLDLLPMAFSKRSAVTLWIDPKASLLIVDVGSQKRADEAVTQLIKSAPGLSVTLLQSAVAPAVAMAGWLGSAEAPAGFTIDRECELQSSDDMKSVVRYSRHALDVDDVRQHIGAGKLPTRLAMSWNDRVSFVLTESLQLKKIAFLDGALDQTASSDDDRFDADAAIATGELRQLIPAMIEALGGDLDLIAQPAAAEPSPRAIDPAMAA
ncbi:MAG: recombination-associated protein RdgC [Ideonella sp.]